MSLVSKLRGNLWLLRTCRDWETLRAMKQGDAAPTSELRSLRLRSLDPPLLYRPGTTDIYVAWELFHGREYECTGPWDFPTVVDCGANAGLFMAYALMKMGSRLRRYVGVEPDAESFAVLERQAVTLGIRSKCDLYQAAVHERDGELAFDARGPSWART
jgi:predicted RNA methylase